ncbi:hypothetical protein ACP4OV_014780 [Aristida adscensionis]
MEKLHQAGPSRVAPKIMSLESLKEITDNFSEERKLGSGAFGKVYKGVHDGKQIAVKMLHLTPGIDDLDQFKREFENLWRVGHQNVVELLGYCYEIRLEFVELGDGKTAFGQNIYRALCFEYMHNGSLKKHLSDEYRGLDWQTRYKIIKGTCEGLRYLHEGLEHPIYHMDIKPDNILLDKDMVPKLADFGLSKLVCNDQTQATRSSIGTIGYLPPEYIERNLVSKKLDIFSLGVVMIQIMAGIKGYHNSAYMSSQEFIDLVHENWRKRLQGTLRCSSSLEAVCHQVKRSIEIALDCVHADRKKRPIIGDIVHWLNQTEQMIKMASSLVSKLVDDVQLISVSAAPSPPQDVISLPKGHGETSSTETCSLKSFESIKLLDVYPLELRFPWEPNTGSISSVTLTNRMDHCVGVWITPVCQDPCSDLHFLVSWEGKSPEVPCSTLYRRVGPHSTLVVTMTMEEKQLPQPPREVGKFEVVMIDLGSDHVLLRPDLKLKLNSDFVKTMEKLGREIYRATLRAVICEPSSCQAVMTHQTCSLGSSESIRLLDVYPLELRFPWKPNTRIICPVTLTNRTDHCVGVWITPICQDPCSDLHFLVFWEGKCREVPCSTLYQRVGAHSTLVVTMTMEEKQLPPPPREVGKFEVVMIDLGSEHVLLRSDLKLKLNNDFLKRMEESGSEIYRATLRAVIYDPLNCHAVRTRLLVSETTKDGYISCIDAHPDETLILVGDTKGWVSIWNYRTQERVMALKVTRVHTSGVSPVHSVIFISRKQWFATGDGNGWVHIYASTSMDKVKEFEAHRGEFVNSLAVHPTYPFLITSSPNDASMKLWDWSQEWKCTRTFDVPDKSVIRLIWNPMDTNTFSSVSLDRTIKVWNVHSSCAVTSMVESYSAGYIFSDSHRHLMATTCYQLSTMEGSDCASIWDMQTVKRAHKLAVRGDTSLLVCHPTLPIFATLLDYNILCLWDATTFSAVQGNLPVQHAGEGVVMDHLPKASALKIGWFSRELEKMVKLTDSPVHQGMIFTGTKDLVRLVLKCVRGVYVMEIDLTTVRKDT